jgi:hypothetical protein
VDGSKGGRARAAKWISGNKNPLWEYLDPALVPEFVEQDWDNLKMYDEKGQQYSSDAVQSVKDRFKDQALQCAFEDFEGMFALKIPLSSQLLHFWSYFNISFAF